MTEAHSKDGCAGLCQRKKNRTSVWPVVCIEIATEVVDGVTGGFWRLLEVVGGVLELVWADCRWLKVVRAGRLLGIAGGCSRLLEEEGCCRRFVLRTPWPPPHVLSTRWSIACKKTKIRDTEDPGPPVYINVCESDDVHPLEVVGAGGLRRRGVEDRDRALGWEWEAPGLGIGSRGPQRGRACWGEDDMAAMLAGSKRGAQGLEDPGQRRRGAFRQGTHPASSPVLGAVSDPGEGGGGAGRGGNLRLKGVLPSPRPSGMPASPGPVASVRPSPPTVLQPPAWPLIIWTHGGRSCHAACAVQNSGLPGDSRGDNCNHLEASRREPKLPRSL